MIKSKKQQKAIAANQLILHGGPGTGKTYCMLEKIKDLINQKPLEKILILCFNNYHLEKFQSDIEKLQFNDDENQISLFTFDNFHRWCSKNFIDIVDGTKQDNLISPITLEKQEDIVEEIWKKHFCNDHSAPKSMDDKQTAHHIQYINLLRQKDNPEEWFSEIFEESQKIEQIKINRKIYKKKVDIDFPVFKKTYQEYCKKITQDSPDKAQIIKTNIEKLKKHENIFCLQEEWSFLMVDEFQSSNDLQYSLICELTKIFKEKIWIVGDDHQCTTDFIGGTGVAVQNFSDKFTDFLKIKLSENYRNSKKIIQSCNHLVPENKLLYCADAKDGNIEFKKCTKTDKENVFVVQKILDLCEQSQESRMTIAVLHRQDIKNQKFSEYIQDRMKSEKDLFKENKVHIVADRNPRQQQLLKSINCLLYFWSFDMESIKIVKIKYAFYLDWYHAARHSGGVIDKKHFEEINERWQEQNEIVLEDIKKHPGIVGDQKESAENFYKFIKRIRDVVLDGEDPIKSAVNLIFKLWKEAGWKSKTDNAIFSLTNQIQEKLYANNKKDHLNKKNISKISQQSARSNPKNNSSDIQDKNQIWSLTLNSLMGMEFDCVFICGCREENIPIFYATDQSDEKKIKEEKRLFYDAVSTAKTKLFLIYSPENYKKNNDDGKESRFISEMRL